MTEISVPYAKTHITADVPDANLIGIFEPDYCSGRSNSNEDEIVQKALQNPIGSVKLSEMTADIKKMVIITSDHTRPVPSSIIMPHILAEARRGNPDLKITILVATGFHRATTRDELIDKLGVDIVEKENIIIHDSEDKTSLLQLDNLPSGGELWLNRIAIDTDLLIAEGFIEPHFFAGFSGGRKSVLPGIAGTETVLANHCAEFINSPFAKTGSLDNNPIHRDMLFASKAAKLAFIVNVIINKDKKIVEAFAGDPEKAHATGCDSLSKRVKLNVPQADIIITSNGGYPLDQNIYQAVKGMTAAEPVLKKNGVIIMAAACNDGHGGESFYNTLAESTNPAELVNRIEKIPRNKTLPDQWEAQILVRILSKYTVILVTDLCDRKMIEDMHMLYAPTLEKAVEKALCLKGGNASVAVIPDGVSVIVG